MCVVHVAWENIDVVEALQKLTGWKMSDALKRLIFQLFQKVFCVENMCTFERTPLNYLVEHFNYEGVQAVTAVVKVYESCCACVLLQTPDVFIGSQRQEALCPLKMNFSICCFCVYIYMKASFAISVATANVVSMH